MMLCLASPAFAQQSPSYKLEEYVFNSGGDPTGGAFASSASYRIKLDAVGEGVIGPGLGSASFRMDGGFAGAYPPPGEVLSLFFPNKSSLAWSPERSVGTYDLYRDLVSTLPGSFGSCSQSAIGGTSATDASNPATHASYFYLVTAKNRLAEEGTKGYSRFPVSGAVERPNPAPCP